MGAAVALLLVGAGALVGSAAPVALLAILTPLASATVSAAGAGAVLHWRKVSSPGAVHVGVIGLALAVLATGQFLCFADLAALVRAGWPDVLRSPAVWSAAFATPSLEPSELGRIPGVSTVVALFGAEGAWVFLVVELTLVLGLARWMTGRLLAARLCLACRAWCVRERGVVERAANAAAPDLVRQRVVARDWRFFRELGPARGGASLRFDLARCPSCNRNNAVSVMWERPLWRDRCLVDDVRLGSDDMRTLLDLVDANPKPHAAA